MTDDAIGPVKLEKAKDFEIVVVPEDMYNAKISGLRKFSGQFGEALAISFTITDGDHAGKTVDGIANLTKLTKKAKLFKWAQTAGCIMPDEEGSSFDPNTLMGKEVRVLTKDKERKNEKGTYFQSNVAEVLKKA